MDKAKAKERKRGEKEGKTRIEEEKGEMFDYEVVV